MHCDKCGYKVMNAYDRKPHTDPSWPSNLMFCNCLKTPALYIYDTKYLPAILPDEMKIQSKHR